jgi:hypothetical protein
MTTHKILTPCGFKISPQQAWVAFHKTVRVHLSLPANLIV